MSELRGRPEITRELAGERPMPTFPRRIQRQRTRGWRMPEGAIYVGRPTDWGNPFIVGKNAATLDEALVLYLDWLMRYAPPGGWESVRAVLCGHDLVCWRPLNRRCHADILLDIASTPTACRLWQRGPSSDGEFNDATKGDGILQ
jgi:hypothetical protein